MKFYFKIEREVNSKKWNDRLCDSDYATFFQTSEYLSFESRTDKRRPYFISVYDETNLVKGQLGLVIYKQINAYSSSLLNYVFHIFSNLGSRGLWAGGPIIHSEDKKERLEILANIIKALEEISKVENLSLVSGYTPHYDILIDEDYKNEFWKNNYKINGFFTYITELNGSLEEIWNSLSKNAQRDVNRAQKRNISIKELKYENLEDYLQISKIWAKTKGIKKDVSEKYKEDYWDYYKKGFEKVFLAFENNELISSHRVGCFNKIAFSHKLTNTYAKSGSLGGPLLTWHAIKWAKEIGMNLYDFSGGESPPTNPEGLKRYREQWSSLLSYKKKWGGKEYPYYNVVKIRKKRSYRIFRLLNKLDWIYRNFKKRRYQRTR